MKEWLRRVPGCHVTFVSTSWSQGGGEGFEFVVDAWTRICRLPKQKRRSKSRTSHPPLCWLDIVPGAQPHSASVQRFSFGG